MMKTQKIYWQKLKEQNKKKINVYGKDYLSIRRIFMDTKEQAVVVDLTKEPILADNQSYKEQLKLLPEVQNMTNEINIQDADSILMFGQAPSEEISNISNELLSSMKSVKAEEVSQMLTQLTKIMDKFDIREIENPEETKGALKKIFGKVKNSVDKMFEKYEDMGKEVDQVYQILKKYELDIHKTNDNLKKQYDANVQFFKQLEKYVVAGEIGIQEIEAYKQKVELSNEQSPEEKQMVIQNLDMAKEMLAQRVYDLQIAENVAMQTCPMIRTMQMSNYNLLRKINTSFIITLPIFKQCLVQAIQLKRQAIQAKSMKELDDKTNELLLKNAQNTAQQSVAIARMAGGSSIQIETLQQTYETIKNGIEETRQVNAEIAEKRHQDAATLEIMKKDMKQKGFAG